MCHLKKNEILQFEEPSNLSGVIILCFSFVSFSFLYYLCNLFIDPIIPKCAITKKVRIYNLIVSLIHCGITSFTSHFLFYYRREKFSDLKLVYTREMYFLLALSTGYFIYDTVLSIRFYNGKMSNEIILHHFTVILCFSIALYTRQYVGYGIIALFIEFHNVFLHSRQLLILMGVKRENPKLRVLCFVNLVDFVIHRFAMFSFMTYWLWRNSYRIPHAIRNVGTFGLLSMSIISSVLFLRLYQADFSSKAKTV